jgi:hypothetical protein
MTGMAVTVMPQATGGSVSGELYKVVELILGLWSILGDEVRQRPGPRQR